MTNRIIVKEYTKIKGTDGEWYIPHGGMPAGAKWTGEKKVVGFVLSDGACTFGQCYNTKEEAEQAAEKMNADKEAN